MLKILFLTLFLFSLQAQELASNYYVNSKEIKLSDILTGVKNDAVLYTIAEGRYTKRIKTKDLIKLLRTKGYLGYSSSHAYTKFEQDSPINTQKIKQYLKNTYQKAYINIDITKIQVHPRGYIKSLPQKYSIKMQKKATLHDTGTLAILSKDKKQLFFDYTVEANVVVYIASTDIKRKEELSYRNTRKKSIILHKFRALPIQSITQGALQSKFYISKGDFLTLRDVETIDLVKRGSMVNVILYNAGLSISFSAKALHSGKNGDTITLQQSNGKKIKAVVIGRNRAEVR